MGSYGQYVEDELPKGFINIIQKINEPIFTHTDTDFSTRMLNYYANKNLLFEQNEAGGKRWFSAVQLLWLMLLKELIERGYSTDLIFNLKEDMEIYKYISTKLDSYNLLEFNFALAVEYKSDLRLLIDKEAEYSLYNFSTRNIISHPDHKFDNPHFHIPLFNLIKSIWKKTSGQSINVIKPQNLYQLSDLEKKMLPDLRNSNFNFQLTTKKPKSAKNEIVQALVEKEIDIKKIKSLGDFLKKQKFSEVKIVFHEKVGEPVHIYELKKKRYNMN